MGCQGAAVGVAGRKGAGGVLHNVPEALVGQVAHVCDDVQTLHLSQELEALFFQARLGVGGAGPDVVAPAGDDVGAGKLVLVVPGQSHHADAQLVHPAQHADAALAAAALFDGEHSADLSLGGVFSDVRGFIYRCNILRVFFHDAFEDVDFFQRRHQRVGTGGLVAQIDKGGEALQHIVALFQFLQVDMQIILRKALGRTRLFGVAQLTQGVTM